MRAIAVAFLVLLQTASVSPRRRAVRPNPAPCTRPALFLTLSKTSACSGEPVTLFWQASDASAVVSIVGVGTSLPPGGSKSVAPSVTTTYSGRATNACGIGNDAIAEVRVQQAATASLRASASSLQQGQSMTLTISVANVDSWTLSSSPGNFLSATFGVGSGTVTYTATRSGTDTIILNASGGCGSVQSSVVVPITAATPTPPPPPPPSSGTLRCCDGTFSPSCTSCAKKQGCCSSHGGVCGC